MASAKSFDLYTCKVCLENMLDKNPRLLSCHHSFCTDCLKKVMKGGVILCPTCREKTIVPNKEISSLKVNFMLQRILRTFGTAAFKPCSNVSTVFS